MKKKFLLFLGICYLSIQFIYASYSLYDLPSLNNQLSNNAILTMYQDKYGLMWFGTYDGLNMYDGKDVHSYRFEFNNPDALSGNIIHNIFTADNNCIWIATQMGLDKFSLNQRKVIESYPNKKIGRAHV